jgi:phosphatidylglycerol:prolipoprotein diacylglycerol transferase
MTLLELPFPKIDPVFLHLGPVQLRWYGLMYMVSFIIGYFVLKRLNKAKKLSLTSDDLYDLLFFLILGVMVGGRIGYVLFYDLGSYIQRPLEILYIWQGGMSFHGGFAGIVLALFIICKRRGWNFWEIADLVCATAPILALVRLGNFINGELYGRATTMPWGMIFPDGGDVVRHPSQIYEFLLEGVVMLLILQWLYRKNLYPGTVAWASIGFYGLFRFLVEFVREPDAHIGFDLGPFTRGQLLSAPMLVIGLAMMIIYARRNPPEPHHRPYKSRGRSKRDPQPEG